MAQPLKLKSGKVLDPSRSNLSPENTKSSPIWLKGYEPSIANNSDTFVGFAEYLRWMRSPDTAEKDKTKLEILQLAAEKAKGYKKRLEILTNRTKLIAGAKNTFNVTSTWRIRVGGQRGPESMLLPAWDALGIPYIPSSTLRGVARDRAIREFMAEGMDYQAATKAIAPYFGSIDSSTQKEDRSGKVIFLDAYPIPSDSGALAVDLANNIWKWDGDLPKYGASPFSFLSLVKPTLTIGIKPTQKCDDETFDRVKAWLIAGLQAGIGSQVNSGYGELLEAGAISSEREILKKPIKFIIKGQLIHGVKLPGESVAQAEVRPIAFRAILRYWFRAFALGVLPASDVKELEAQLFGSINPKPSYGWVSVQIANGKVDRSEPKASKDPYGLQSGTLVLRYSASAPVDRREQISQLLKTLTWLMFHLGGVGQGARRPLYSRASRKNPPWWRGSNLELTDKDLLELSDTVEGFHKLFRINLQAFYAALAKLRDKSLKYQSVRGDGLAEAIDLNCEILICQGNSINNKPYALGILHLQEFKIEVWKYGKKVIDYDPELCGKMMKPSPVWICDKGKYQVVTVFGANSGKRKQYIEKLKEEGMVTQIFLLQ